MMWLEARLEYLRTFPRVLFFEWAAALGRLLRGLRDSREEERGISERERRAATSRCVPIGEPAFVHPDPLIYSQFDLISRGFAVTWDNPDIQLYRNGAPVPSSLLESGTAYEIVARIWNNSTEAPILGLPVTFSALSFGIGTKSEPIGQTGVNLGVKGGPDHPAFARMTWETPREEGQYCLQVLLEWPDDSNPANNRGQENTTVGRPHSPAEFTFTLRNATRDPHTYWFEVDAYRIPDLLTCDQLEGEDARRRARARRVGARQESPRISAVRPRHNRRAYSLPSGWSVTVEPSELHLLPDEERVIRVMVNAPDGFRDRQPLNVNAFYGQDVLAGGVTLYVEGGQE